jgi:3-deoxy-D-manno-octulosonic-acid transferase
MGTCIHTSFQNRICSNKMINVRKTSISMVSESDIWWAIINNIRKTSISMVSESDIWGNIINNIRGTRIFMVL